jgi:ribosome-associated protein
MSVVPRKPIERQDVATIGARQTSKSANSNRAYERALAAAQTAHETRGRDIVLLDLREVTPEFDYFVLVTGSSVRQLHAISDEIDHTLEKGLQDRRRGMEGYQQGGWIVLDYGDVIVHLFDEKMRDFYRLDDLWAQAKRIAFTPKEPGR